MYTGKSAYASPDTFFQSPSQNTSSLEFYLNQLPTFSVLLAKLQSDGLFLTKKPETYSIGDFLADTFSTRPTELNLSPTELLLKPFSLDPLFLDTLTETEKLDEAFESLAEKRDLYIELMCKALESTLAQKSYEKKCDQELVNELEHAQEAGKISYLLYRSLAQTISLYFHDIARITTQDTQHAHLHHCKEGSTILSPLGLEVDYASLHAFAKFLLNTFCADYQDLISNTSRYTLGLQAQDWSYEMGLLNALDGKQLAQAIYTIMLMRLIDDMSKVPVLELKQQLKDKDLEFFDIELTEKMLKKQITNHLNSLANQAQALEEVKEELEKRFDAALVLLQRENFTPGLGLVG